MDIHRGRRRLGLWVGDQQHLRGRQHSATAGKSNNEATREKKSLRSSSGMVGARANVGRSSLQTGPSSIMRTRLNLRHPSNPNKHPHHKTDTDALPWTYESAPQFKAGPNQQRYNRSPAATHGGGWVWLCRAYFSSRRGRFRGAARTTARHLKPHRVANVKAGVPTFMPLGSDIAR